MPRKMLTAKISTTPSHMRTCTVLIFTIQEMISFNSTESFDDVQSLCVPRCPLHHLQCSLRCDIIIRFSPASVTTKCIVDYRARLFTTVKIHTLYVGFKKTENSVGGISSNIARANLSVHSDSMFPILVVVAPCFILILIFDVQEQFSYLW